MTPKAKSITKLAVIGILMLIDYLVPDPIPIIDEASLTFLFIREIINFSRLMSGTLDSEELRQVNQMVNNRIDQKTDSIISAGVDVSTNLAVGIKESMQTRKVESKRLEVKEVEPTRLESKKINQELLEDSNVLTKSNAFGE